MFVSNYTKSELGSAKSETLLPISDFRLPTSDFEMLLNYQLLYIGLPAIIDAKYIHTSRQFRKFE